MTHAADQTEAEMPDVDEDLVAYLDGELDDEGIRRVEARLAADAAYRQELAKLQTAWDCLDVLPETSIDSTFTRKTIEMVAMAAQAELAETQAVLPKMQRTRRWRAAAVMLGGLAIGFVMVTVLRPSPTRQLARDLPVLENLDLYLPIDNLAYLQDLSALKNLPPLEGLPTDTKPGAATSPTVASPPASPARATSNESAQVRLTQLTSTEKAQLAASEQRFARLQPAEQARLRDLAAIVEQASDRNQLFDTLVRYHAWLADLSPGEQAELAGLAPPERLKEVEKLLAEQQLRRDRELSAEDRKVLLTFLETYAVAHREELLKQVPEQRRRELNRVLEKADSQHQSGMLMMMFWQHSRYSHSGQAPKLPVPSEEELRPLLASLSPAARQQLEQLENKDDRRRLMQSWVGSTIRHRMMERVSTRDAKQITQEQLEKFFSQEISSEERARLLALPREEMDRELRRLMLAGEDTPGWRVFEGGRPPGGFHREAFGPPGEHGPGGFRTEKHPPGADHDPDDRPGHPPFGPRGDGPEGDHPRGDGPRFDRGPQRDGEFRPEGGRGPEGGPRRFGRPGDGFRPKPPESGVKRPGEKESPEADQPKANEPADDARSV
jgi:hypothetical protein